MSDPYNLDVIDLSGTHPFRLSAKISTKKKGSILCKCFSGPLWKNGGEKGQAKCLFVNDKGYLCFDIGWVGCIESRPCKVNDGKIHMVELHFVMERYHLYVDGSCMVSGLHAVPDHPKTTVRIGVDSALMKEFRGSITEITYSSIAVPPCSLHTTVSGEFGHLDRVEPLTPVEDTANSAQKRTVASVASNAKSKVTGATGSAFVAAARASLKPDDRAEFDENFPGAMREIRRDMRDVGALSAELGKSAAQGAKTVALVTKDVACALREVPATIVRNTKEDIECTFTHLPWCWCDKCKRCRERRNRYNDDCYANYGYTDSGGCDGGDGGD